MEDILETKADDFLFRIRKAGKIGVYDLKEQMGVDEKTLERWITIFEESGFIERVYPANPLEQPLLVVKNG